MSDDNKDSGQSVHEQKKSKNYALLAVLVSVVVILFFATMIKISS